jgi:hypothetical protein
MAFIKPSKPRINWAHPLTKGLIFDVPFIEGSGPPNDWTDYRNGGTIVGTAPWILGLHGRGLSFNGSSQSVTYETGQAQMTQSVFTIMALINVPSASGTGTNRTILCYFDVGNQVPQFRVDNGEKLALISSNVANVGASTVNVDKDKWVLATVTYNAAGNFAFYQNGTLIGSGTNLLAFATTQKQVSIGQQNGGSKEWFNGNIALVRMWKRALRGTEVQQLVVNPWMIYFDTRNYGIETGFNII